MTALRPRPQPRRKPEPQARSSIAALLYCLSHAILLAGKAQREAEEAQREAEALKVRYAAHTALIHGCRLQVKIEDAIICNSRLATCLSADECPLQAGAGAGGFLCRRQWLAGAGAGEGEGYGSWWVVLGKVGGCQLW